jgi:hypothetical protein
MDHDNPPTQGSNPTGPGGTIVDGHLYDLAPSVHDPATDLTFPLATYAEWKEMEKDERKLLAAIRKESAAVARRTHQANDQDLEHRNTSRQGGLQQDRLEKLLESSRSDDELGNTVARSAQEFRKVMERFEGQLPPAVDLRAFWYPIRDQRDSGGCVGWAVADAIWRQSKDRLDIPSARFIWQAAKELDGDPRPTGLVGSTGTSVRAALTLATTWGYALESELPSSNNSLYRGSAAAFFRTIGTRKIPGFVNLGNDLKTRLAWLSLGRPIISVLQVGRRFLSASKEVVEPDPEGGDEDFLHALVLAGYQVDGHDKPLSLGTLVQEGKTTAAEPSPVKYLIRNSAGVAWADHGYGWIHHDAFANRFRESYGILP